jgi:NAD-dependent dihydropyrimidine dehydrogenase PreA subunit
MIKKVMLRYSTQRATEPILASVIKQTGVLLNILYADFTSRGGEILLAIDAPERDVKRVIGLLKQRGVEVQELKRAIQLDEEKCFSCGACLSLCPTGALRFAKDYSLELDEDKCVYCEICVPACPVGALKVLKY